MTKIDDLRPSKVEKHAQPANYAYGIAFMLLSEVCWVSMNAMIKDLGTVFPAVQLLFFRNVVTIPAMLILLLALGKISALRTQRPFAHISQAIVGSIGMLILIFSLSRLTLSQTVSITYAAPLIITALSVPILGEPVGVRRWLGVIVGFIGVLILARPGAEIDPIVFVVLAGTFCFAIVVILRRRLSTTEHSATIVLYFSITGALGAAIFLPWYWQQPSAQDWVMLFIMGTFAVGAQFWMMQAIKHAPVSVISPMLYFSLVFAVAIDIAFWGNFPDQATLIGAGIIILAGLYIIYRETGLSKD